MLEILEFLSKQSILYLIIMFSGIGYIVSSIFPIVTVKKIYKYSESDPNKKTDTPDEDKHK